MVEPSVFFVARDSNQILRQDPVQFQIEFTDRFDDFDTSTSAFRARTNGAYFFSLSAGIIDGRRTTYSLSSELNYIEQVSILRQADDDNGDDTTSRDVIMYLNPNDDFVVTSEGSLASTSDGLETSFGGFSLHDILRSPYTAFSVARDTAYSLAGSTILFTVENVNEGRFFNLNSGVFTVQETGLYFFSFSIGIDGSDTTQRVKVQLRVDGQNRAEILRDHADYIGYDTLSRYLCGYKHS